MSVYRTRSQTVRENQKLLETVESSDNFREIYGSNLYDADVIEEEFLVEAYDDTIDNSEFEEVNVTRQDHGVIENALFDVNLKLFTKNFVNERNPLEVHIHCVNIDGFKQLLWPAVKKHIKKEDKEVDGKWE